MPDEMELAANSHRSGEVVCDTYVLGDIIGVGGMGIVYAATQTSLHRTVAVKLPKPELVGDIEVQERFRTEATTGARVQHRNVVGVIDFGHHADAPFLVMERVIGARLGDVFSHRGPMPLAVAANLVHQVLAGLASVHSAGVIHGDVKCDNVLVESLRDGSSIPRLTDFGLARFAGEKSPACTDGFVAGTPDYLAPELARGEATSFATDIYAIGIMCYELVTGATPFAGGSAEQILEKHLHDLPPPLSARRPRVPRSLDAFVARSLAKLPSDRFANAREMRDSLADVALELATRQSARRDEAHPTLYSSEEPTSRLHLPHRLALGTNEPLTRLDQRQREVANARLTRDPEAMLIAYLELARALVDAHDLPAAIMEIERGIAQIARSERSGPVWRLQLTLAALYDGNGDRVRACVTMRAALDDARRNGSVVGEQRAKALFVRLVCSGAPRAPG